MPTQHMIRNTVLLTAALWSPALFAQSSLVNIKGSVVMEDGSPLPKKAGIQRVCTDRQGDKPGPLTGNDGSFLWRLDIDYMASRKCWLKATLDGFVSTEADLTGINPSVSVNVELPPIIMKLEGGNPYEVGGDEKNITGKGKKEWDAAMDQVRQGNINAAGDSLEAAVTANPKLWLAWHNLGIIRTYQGRLAEADVAFNSAIQQNSKMLQAHVALVRTQIKLKNWDGAVKTAKAAMSLDKNKIYPELNVHTAVAQYELKDLASAEASVNGAFDKKYKRRANRAEYVLGRILEAKGDQAGAKQHMQAYLQLEPKASDAAEIQDHISKMGQAGAPEPQLVVLVP